MQKQLMMCKYFFYQRFDNFFHVELEITFFVIFLAENNNLSSLSENFNQNITSCVS
jgi:hypothetical protein